jgi:iron complex outermembrane recepter protein
MREVASSHSTDSRDVGIAGAPNAHSIRPLTMSARIFSRSLAAPPSAWSALALSAAMALPLGAQGTVEGTVFASRGTARLSDVSVFVVGLRRGAVTDAQGHYRITAVPAGTQRLIAQRVGFAADTVSITVSEAASVAADFHLHEAATVVAPVVVSATRELQRRSEGSVTIDALGADEIRVTRASHPADLMNRLAGVHVSQLSGEGHSMAIRLPITTSPLYLYLEDGIPTRATGFFNHNALYEVNIPQSAGVEVIKGPGTALYGSDAIGGIVNVLTRPAPLSPSLESSVEGGANGYRRMLATGGTRWGHHGVRVDLNVTHSDNWKEDAPFDRQSGTIRWDAVTSNGWTARTVLTGSRIDQQDVPAVSRPVFDTATTINLAPIAFRTVRALRLSSAIEKQAGASLWSFTSYGRVDDMGLLPSWQLSFDPQVWDTKNNSLGFLARWRRDVSPLDGQIIVGVDGDLSPGSFTANRAVTTRSGPYRAYTSYTKGESQYDYDVTYRAVSPYVQTQWAPTKRFHIDAGVRADVAGYDYSTHLAPLDTGAHRRPASTSVSYTHVSPKVGATFELSQALGVYASYRNGFRAPSQGQLFQQNSAKNTVGLDPVKVNSYESGVRGQLASRVVYQISAYDMTISDDILTFVAPQNTREATNAGRSRHRGVEASAGVALASDLRLDVAYSIASHRYVDWTPQAARSGASAINYSGKVVELAPRDLGDVLLTWSPSVLRSGRIALEWSHTGRYAEDPANSHYYGGHDLLSANANVFVASRAELFARVANLANRRFAELVTYDAFQKDQYTPGAPRSIYAGLRYAW